MAQNETPQHIAFIMDGNGRWAQSRGLPRLEGHRKGAETVRRLVENISSLGIQTVTFYAFSSENWKRPEEEVKGLMRLLKHYFTKEHGRMAKEGVRLRIFGDLDPKGALGEEISSILKKAEAETAGNTKLNVNFCINYGGRNELVRAFKKMHSKINAGDLSAENVSEDDISQHLDSHTLPDPELMIRTGGDRRLSNFLLWQTSYSELMFVDTLWPDFSMDELQDIIHKYTDIDRRFGALNSKA